MSRNKARAGKALEITNTISIIDKYLASHDPSLLKSGAIMFLMDIANILSGDSSIYKDVSIKDDIMGDSIKDDIMGEGDSLLNLLFDIPLLLVGSPDNFLQPEMEMGNNEIGMLTENMMSADSVELIESSVAADEILPLDTGEIMEGGIDEGIMDADMETPDINIESIIDTISNAPNTQAALDNLSDLIDQIQSGLLSNEQLDQISSALDDYMDELGTEDDNAKDIWGSP